MTVLVSVIFNAFSFEYSSLVLGTCLAMSCRILEEYLATSANALGMLNSLLNLIQGIGLTCIPTHVMLSAVYHTLRMTLPMSNH